MTDIDQQVQTIRDDLVAWRRDFHRHPELAFQEVRTARIVAQKLESLGLEVQTGIGGTGVVGVLEGDADGPTVMIRCDMDALPIHEENDVDYISLSEEAMHACGHDGHTAIALGTATILAAQKSRLKGRVKFLFQPAEETSQGAAATIKAGVLESPRPDVCLGLHLWNELPIGEVAIPSGPSMAGADVLNVHIKGRGSHAALPHLSTDPVICMSHTILALQSIVSRNINAQDSVVLSITQLQGSNAFNVIPDSVTFSGTLRTFTPGARIQSIHRIEEIVNGVAATFQCEAKVSIKQLTPAVTNDPRISAELASVVEKKLPELTVHTTYRTMAAEDVAYFLEQIPGVYLMVGSANIRRGLDNPHHHPRFDFDEEVLATGVSLLTHAALQYLMT